MSLNTFELNEHDLAKKNYPNKKYFLEEPMTPELSIIIPMHNNEHTITKALDSILVQGIASIEIIIVDDLSTDNGVAVVRDWAQSNPIPVEILQNEKQLYALKTRMRGVAHAKAHDIMFMDGDDILLGSNEDKRLLRALKQKQSHNCDILHCRSQFVNLDGENMGENHYLRPLDAPFLEQPDLFDTYAKQTYFPVVFWGKIFSKRLLEEVSPYAEKKEFYRFEDKYFVTLLMLFAKTYASSEEYLYLYKIHPEFHYKKFTNQAKSLLETWRILAQLMEEKNITPSTQKNVEKFFHWRLTLKIGNISIQAEEALFTENESSDTIFKTLDTDADDADFFSCLLLSSIANANLIGQKYRRITREF